MKNFIKILRFLCKHAIGCFLLLFFTLDLILLALIGVEVYYGELLIRKDAVAGLALENFGNIQLLYDGQARNAKRIKLGKYDISR